MKQNKALSLIGLATKAGKTASGEFATEKAAKSRRAFLVIIAEDASDNTKKMFQNTCTFYEIPICFFGTKESLGHAMGKMNRASLAIIDQGLAKAVMSQINA